MTASVQREHAALRRALHLLDLDRRRLLGAVLAGSAGLGSAVALTATSAWLIARASQMPAVLDLTVAVVAVRAFGIARAVFRYVERLASHDVALRGMTALRERIYSGLAAGRTDVVVGLRRGDLLARTGADVDAVGDLVVRALLPAAVAGVVGLGTVVLVAALLPAAAVVLAASLLLAGVVAPLLTARAARLAELGLAHERAEVSALALTLVDSAGELQVSGRVPALLDAVRAGDARLAAVADRAAAPAAAGAALNLLAMGLAVVGALLLGVPATTAGTLAPVELAVVVLVPLAAFEVTGMLPAAAVQLVRSAAAAVRVVDLLDAAGAAPAPDAVGAASGAVEAGTVEVTSGADLLVAGELACGWPGEPPVVAGVDLALGPGRAVAVVGPSGVGKTTLLLTLAGLLPARGGTVRVAGRDPWLADRAEVSRVAVLTAEDAHVFDTSVLENLRVARGDVTAADARHALQAAGLSPWLAGLPDGLDTRLGADGTTVSGGERRRLLLARALLTAAPLLLLDEPAEHLDPASADALVVDLLRAAAAAGRGVLLVTHRLSALPAVDEVMVLDRTGARPGDEPARVVARGRHADLVARLPAYAWAWSQEHTVGVGDGDAPGSPPARPERT
jgi:ATP-binding cassette subfamily C protein CydC